ncbi:MAG: hypothetical protein ACFFC7_17110, partial [Candidatus Hermodarchaeota archaeon]
MKQNCLIIPINIYEGIIEIHGELRLHPLHELILELVVTEKNLENVINAFGLDKRIVQEAIVDLMYKEMVYVDLERSLIFISSEVADCIDQGRLDQFLGNEFPETVTVRWVQDTITGQVMMFDEIYSYFRKPINLDEDYISSKDRLQLKSRDFIKIRDLHPQTLVKIAKMTLRSVISEGDVLARVNRIRKIDMIDNRLIYVPLVKRTIDGSSHEVPIASSIPPNVLEYWTKVLTEVDAYSISDLTPVDDEFLAQYDWKTLLKKWTPIIGKLSILFKKGQGNQNVRRFAEDAIRSLEYPGLSSIIPQMDEHCGTVGTISTRIVSGEELFFALEKALDEANDLIVIGSAFISEQGLEKIVPLLRRYVEKKINVILMWGRLGDPIDGLKSAFPLFKKEN